LNKTTVVVLDTNVLIDNPRAIFGFPNDLVIIPAIVVDELDNLKDSVRREVRGKSRAASNFIDELTEANEESNEDYMYLENGGVLKIDEEYSNEIKTHQPDKPDNIIISTAIRYAKLSQFITVTMYSNDTNVRNKIRTHARANGLKQKVKARKYMLIDNSLHEIDSGVKDVILSDEDIKSCRDKKYIPMDLPFVSGEHILLKAESNPDGNQILAQWNATMNRVVPIRDFKKGEPIWRIGGGKPGATDVRPIDSRQSFLANDLLNTSKNLHFVLSRVAGAGKNYIATACALNLLQKGAYDKLIVIKPMISVEGSDTGYLPGTKEEKMAPWFESFNDTMFELTNDSQSLPNELDTKIELDIITHMRGRSIPNVIMIIDEAQNFSDDALKTLMTRAGKNAKIILMGDLSQIDNPRLDSSNCGLRVWAERARNPENGFEDSTYILLDSNFRSKLSAWASSFYE
jgi:PhoH-like ATPase